MKTGKKWISMGLVLLLVALSLSAVAENPVIEGILSAHAIKNYTEEAVSQEDLDLILAAGAQAPSARNLQPWRFIVVQNAELVSQISRNGGTIIIIAGQQGAGAGMDVSFDCGLATQNMYLAAQSLGLGANIVMSPLAAVNAMADTLCIPEGYEATMVLTIGHCETDAVTRASPRNPVSDVTIYVP